MPVESASQLRELNTAWPLDTDLVSGGAAHFRLLKTLLTKSYLGSFTTQTELDAYLAGTPAALADGATFYLNEQLWLVVNKSLLSSPLDLTFVWQSLDDTYGALVIGNVKQLGGLNPINETGKYYLASIERRRPLARYVVLSSGTEFSSPSAVAAFPNSSPVEGDIIYQYIDSDPSYTFVKIWNGVTWAPVDLLLYNNVASFGQFSATSLVSIQSDTEVSRACKRETIGETHIHVFNPDGWGAEGLMEWYGEKGDLVSTDGTVLYDNLTIANGIYYRTVEGFYGRYGTQETPGAVPSGISILANLNIAPNLFEIEQATNASNPYLLSLTFTMYATGTYAFISSSGPGSFIAGSPSSGPYLDAVGASVGNAFEVQFTTSSLPSGFVTHGGVSKDTWYPLTENRSFSIILNKAPNDGLPINGTLNLTATVREIAIPANTETKSFVMEGTIIEA